MPQIADTIIRDAVIFTADRTQPWAEAMALADGRIIRIGDLDSVLEHRGDDTEVCSVGGRFIMPGIIDGHNHPSLAGRTALFELAVSPAASAAEVLDQLRAAAVNLAPDQWIIGAGWGLHLLEEINSASVLAELDEATGGRPTVLIDISRHNRWANSAAMHIAGVTPAEGVLVDENGTPTGVFFERAGLPVAYAAAREGGLTDEQEQAAYLHSLEVLHSYGITAFQDAGVTPEVLRALHGLDAAGELNAWVVSSLLMNDEVLGAEVIGKPLLEQAEQYRSEHHRPDFVKIFLDGIPPARTAAMLEPYLDDAQYGCGYCGETILSSDELYDALLITSQHGLGAKIHSTGDAATRLILDTVQRLREEGHAFPCQIAHGQYVAPADIPRFAELNVDADISPYIWYPGPLPEAIKMAVPADRAELIHPNRDLVDSGALVSAGSDWPVSPAPNPWEALAGLITRQDPTGQFPGTLWGDQALSLKEAIEVFTINGARMLGIDDDTGSLVTGKSADFIVLDHDLFEIEPREISTTLPTQTWFAGHRVFSR